MTFDELIAQLKLAGFKEYRTGTGNCIVYCDGLTVNVDRQAVYYKGDRIVGYDKVWEKIFHNLDEQLAANKAAVDFSEQLNSLGDELSKSFDEWKGDGQ